ncbi:MAG TPA: deoxyribonuclease V [Blastocatellia bacterium]|nr:deoxyribonuclease V [Blastocatellia bacterium]
MPIQPLHSWDLHPSEAVTMQKHLRDKIVLQPLPDNLTLIAGADISFNKFSDDIYAGIVVLRLPELEVVTTAGVVTTTKFPYVPGLLSFREAPALLEAWEKLTVQPQVLVLDGQGIAHPRRIGIASHIGLWLDLPTVGCAKSLLVGRYEEPLPEAGNWSPLMDKGDMIGAALRTKHRVSPVYISPGHNADLAGSLALALRCCKGYATNGTSKYRIPEPTRLAHLFVNALRRGETWTPPKV